MTEIPTRRRTRLGCLPCRTRRRKCDGARPHCQNCISRGGTCHLSRQEIANLQAVETRRKSQIPHMIINETNDILLDYHTEQQAPGRFPEDDVSRPDIAALWHAGGGFSISDLLALSFTAAAQSPVLGSKNAQLLDYGSVSWSDTHSTPLSLARLAPHHDYSTHLETPLIVSNSERLRLISLYIQETGTWCETTDSNKHFTVQSIHEMMESPAFTSAAMALASCQLDYVDRRERPLTLELYQHTIQLLLRNDTAAPGASVLATCTLLCVYEMMASDVHEWRRHLKGCAGLLQAKKWNGSAPGIVKSCFWAFARIDIWAAFITGKTTLIPTDFWLDDTSIESVRDQGNIDDYCNLPILLFAKIVNLLSANSADINYDNRPVPAFLAPSVWDELQKWYQLRPPEVCPLLEDFPSSKVFPTILLSRSSSICGNTFYHTGCILLLQTGLVATEASGCLSEEMVWLLPTSPNLHR
ncbi:Zn(II)2Cys6 transcription factor [Aspergillus stella-maris]|uniref:Zn(II)2Cys6 transcription factor n=1 Tax=Aspergillus stella-maris TaxID=1810926 RepID=UPI003CCD265A